MSATDVGTETYGGQEGLAAGRQGPHVAAPWPRVVACGRALAAAAACGHTWPLAAAAAKARPHMAKTRPHTAPGGRG